ncbi:Fido domain-containing protein [Hyphomicrobiales bacterium]|nr:Fido domain-containing protein [Hyphomicrobiales bacterium]CAH1702964.1 Fic/DOC family protein [Hyphomicrobiales bacterium]CAI0347150.1 Fido domain-containing protein [Hyphomicrobiales bacterium]
MLIRAIRETGRHGYRQPSGTVLTGYSALIHHFDLEVPMPDTLAVTSDARQRTERGRNHAMAPGGYAVYEVTYRGTDDRERGRLSRGDMTFAEHLVFALKHEATDLHVLRKLFLKVDPELVADMIRQSPTGTYARQAFFFYEWLTGLKLDVPSAGGGYIDALDPGVWHTASPINSPRHRVRDNIPGTPVFAPLVRRSATFQGDLREECNRKASAALAEGPPGIITRLRRRLLLRDSRSTFAIENENPSVDKLEKWSTLVSDAGRTRLDLPLLLGLQKMIIDSRWVNTGIRHNGVWLGEEVDGSLIPNWLGAAPDDLEILVEGIFAADRRMGETPGFDPIAHATAVSFGWLMVHPLADGNGRTHRYILNHILNQHGIRPQGITLPISNAIFADMDGYRETLTNFDEKRIGLIKWERTANGNVIVVNDTRDLYGHFDASHQAAFVTNRLAYCLDYSIPEEITSIALRDRMVAGMREVVDMRPERLDLFAKLVMQNHGRLSKAKREKMFSELSDDELEGMEAVVQEVYSVDNGSSNTFKP